jgi:methyl-accepting chemotaxis protein
MNAVATAISEAVAQQGLATSEIVRTISQASAGTSDVTSNIGAVAEAAQQSGAVAQQVLASSGVLSSQAEDLRRQVDRFLETVRAA